MADVPSISVHLPLKLRPLLADKVFVGFIAHVIPAMLWKSSKASSQSIAEKVFRNIVQDWFFFFSSNFNFFLIF